MTYKALIPWLGCVALLLHGCDCSGPTEGIPCDTDAECAPLICLDGMCTDPGDAGPGSDAGSCTDGRPMCGTRCCAADRVCNAGSCELDCGTAAVCNGMCCAAGLVCEGTSCVGDCDAASRCGAALDVCCGTDQACLSESCVDLGDPCTVTEECEIDEICLPSLSRCVPRDSVEVCEFRPPVGDFSPRVACRWTPPSGQARFDDVVMTPSVMNLTDDNGDGATNTLDIPDIVFIAFDRGGDGCCTGNGRLVIASGLCNADGTMNTIFFLDSPAVGNSSGVALGNLHPDTMADETVPEIVTAMANGEIIAFRRTASDGSAWEELWHRDDLRDRSDRANAHGTTPSIVDINGDGAPEVVFGNVVLNGLSGATIWDGEITVGASAGVGWNSFLGPVSTIADLDLNGTMEVLAGNTLYNGADGSEIWTFDYGVATPGGNCDNGTFGCDGFTGVGDFDDDPEGEVVIIRQGEAFVIQHTGELLHRVVLPRGTDNDNESGPPTIADFDGDGRPEIGTAGSQFYVVVDFDCVGDPLPTECESENILWTVANDDDSSRGTGSSVFDFEGDGAAEVVYADETSFRIFDGRTGTPLYTDSTHRSNTRLEMPIVVDVDNDGKSEVVIPEPNGDGSLGGIEIWEDADNNWVRTRRVWNQHAYHVTNITEDGQVPRYEEPNWTNSRLNNFRQNVQPGGLFDAPDLQVDLIALGACDADGTVRIDITVANRGALGVAPGINVLVQATTNPGGAVVPLGVATTTTFLLPGQSEVVSLDFMFPGGFTFETFTIDVLVDDDGTGAGIYNECIEDNNSLTSEAFDICSFG